MCLSQEPNESIRKDKSLDDTLTFSCRIYYSSTEGCVWFIEAATPGRKHSVVQHAAHTKEHTLYLQKIKLLLV